VEIISVSADPLERSGAQWRYGYTFKVRNNSSADARVTVQVKFLDGDGYVVDDDIVSELLVPANTEQVVNDEDTLDADLARRVRSVNASFR
jgi:hypothetical protein